MEIYEGTIFQPNSAGDDLERLDRAAVAVNEKGVVEYSGPLNELPKELEAIRRETTEATNLIIMTPIPDTHGHSFQPPGIPGELIEFGAEGTPTGWLPQTLQQGEYLAKTDSKKAKEFAKMKFKKFIDHGTTHSLEYTTSSYDSVVAVLEAAAETGVFAKVGFVAMDQEMESIQPGLEESSKACIDATRKLLETYGPEKIVVIDRFPIAVSSATRQGLVNLCLEYGAQYETHMDESYSEKHEVHAAVYGADDRTVEGPRGEIKEKESIVRILAADGVFQPGMKVGLAHAIHTNEKELSYLESKIKEGCEIYIRACPGSNADLGSHFSPSGYVPFPLSKWQKIGAKITFGTDQGGGRNWSMFQELLDERRRHPMKVRPTNLELLRMSIINGLSSLGINPSSVRNTDGKKANFVVMSLAGSDLPAEYPDDIETLSARIIEGGKSPNEILALYNEGRKLK